MALNTQGRKIIFIIVSFIIAILNISEVVIIVRCKSRKAFDKLLLSLAISDALIGLSVASFNIYYLTTDNTASLLDGNKYANIFFFSVILSLTNLIAITVDRFLAVRFPIKHRVFSTEKRANAVIVTIWSLGIVSVTFTGVMQIRWESQMEIIFNIASGFLLLFGVVMIMVYVNIFYLICKRTVPGKTGRGEEQNARTRNPAVVLKSLNMTERSVFLTGAIVTISFIICTYPLAFNFLIQQSVEKILIVSKVLILLNSLFNPLIYFFKSYFFSRRG